MSVRIQHFYPVTFQQIERLEAPNGQPLQYLNELEHIKGEILANVWPRNRMARISPETGRLLGGLTSRLSFIQ